MDNKKFEQLIDLIINENEEQARALFHDIVVEKSREIYESMMDEEMDGMEEGMGGQVGDLLDEISAEEEGMTEEEDLDIEDSDEDEVVDIEADEEGEEGGEEDLEDRVVDLEDKLDQLMAEFEELMGSEEGEEAGEEMGDEEEMMEAADDEEEEEDTTESLEEAVQLQKVSVTHGDNGSNPKSVVAANSGQAGMASHPTKMGSAEEKGRAAPTSKEVEGASKFKNAPGQKGQDLNAAPKATTSQASGVNTKSPVAK